MFVGYDADNLYVAVRVLDFDVFTDSAGQTQADAPVEMDDSVELFIDGDNSNFATEDSSGTNPEITGSGGRFAICANGAYNDVAAGSPGFGPVAAWHAVAELRPTFDGYEVEFRISLDALGNPEPGDIIGLTIAVNDDDDGGPAERKIIWTGQAHVEAGYGNVLLGTKSYTAALVTAAPVIDGSASAAEYGNASEMVVTPQDGVYDVSAGDDDWEAADHSFTARVAHDAEAIYVAVSVTDDILVNDSAGAGSEDGSTWMDDSIEVFFDADESNVLPTYHQNIPAGAMFDGQYVFTANGAWRDAEAANPIFGAASEWFAAVQSNATGYTVEFKVMKSVLPLPAPSTGVPFGFNICVNDDDGITGGDRKAQLNWSGRPHNEFTYGVLVLGDSTGGGGDEPGPAFTDISVAVDGVTGLATATLTWTSVAGKSYRIDRSPTMAEGTWVEINGNWPSGGASTSFTDSDIPAGTEVVFYRVTEL
jgi:hypothetical protein